jgi:proteasome lid subunit RPN8/RPN11
MDITARAAPADDNADDNPVTGTQRYAIPGVGTMKGAARSSRAVTRIVAALAIAALLPLPSLADESRLEAVAVHALRWAFYAPNGYRWEHSGILVIHNGQLRHSASPSTLKKVDAVEMDVEKQRIPGDILVGLYHTHPCNSDEYFPQYFSPQDLVSAFFWHVPTFILDECTGEVHEFDPLRDRAADTGTVVRILRKDGSRTWVRLPAGRVVGDIGDQGPDLALIERLMSQTAQ